MTSRSLPPSAQISSRFQRALEYLQLGQLNRARTLCEKILKHQPRHHEALHLSGLIAMQMNDPHRAVRFFGKSLTINPNNAAVLCNRASALQSINELEAALDGYTQAISQDPGFGEAYFNLGIVLRLLGRLEEAVTNHNRAVELMPAFAAAHFHRGVTLQLLGTSEAALANYGHAIRLNPGYAEAYLHQGVVLREIGRLQDSLASYNGAIAANPRFVEAFVNRGNLLRQLGQWDAALASYESAIAINPRSAEAHCYRGNLLNELNRIDLAIASYDRALAIDGQYVEAHCNKAVAQLLAGNLSQGWESYEWRRKRQPRGFASPLWLGDEPIAGKTILIHSEQGFGDTLQFCRYIDRVSALGSEVILEVEQPLAGLVSNLTGVAQVVAKGDPLPAFDFQCPMMSLPLAFRTELENIPAPKRYLAADAALAEQWRKKLGKGGRPRIGLAWASSAVLNNNRSIPFAQWVHHLPPGFDYVCLQKELSPADRVLIGENPRIAQFTHELRDFSDTAALCECMDLILSVDTSVAHLSGALGKSTWILLPFNPDWRWLLNRDDSPWYPTAVLYRQNNLGDWSSVLERVEKDLFRAFPTGQAGVDTPVT